MCSFKTYWISMKDEKCVYEDELIIDEEVDSQRHVVGRVWTPARDWSLQHSTNKKLEHPFSSHNFHFIMRGCLCQFCIFCLFKWDEMTIYFGFKAMKVEKCYDNDRMNIDRLICNIFIWYFQLDTLEWQCVSSAAKDLVFRMLSPNPHHRPTVNEILEHPWMRVSWDVRFDDGN